MTRRGWIGLAVVLAIALIWAMIAWQPRVERTEVPSGPAGEPRSPPPSAASEPATLQPRAPERVAAPAPQPATAAEPEPAQPAAAEPVFAAHPMERENLRPPPAQGPLREYRNQYGNESPEAESRQLEARVRALFDDKRVPSDLLDSVQCRRTICKLNVIWTPVYVKSYLTLLQVLRSEYVPEIAAEPVATAPASAEGARPIELYVKLRAR